MEDQPRNDRSLQASLLITLLFIAVLMGIGLFMHPKDEDTKPQSEATATPSVVDTVEHTETPILGQAETLPQSASVGNKARNLLPTKEVLVACRFMPAADNDADSFWIATDTGNVRIKTYYADAPDLVNGGAASTEELMQHFNNLDERGIRSVAKAAKEWLGPVLSGRVFDVVTRWEKDAEETTADVPTYKAFVFFTDQNNKMVNLSSLLVRNGFAKIEKDCKETLPDSKLPSEYLSQLEHYEQVSRQKETGAWNPNLRNVIPATFRQTNP